MEIRIAHGIRVSLIPIYIFKIRISERICLKEEEKIVRIIESFELQKFE